jgi:hypothetical protein
VPKENNDPGLSWARQILDVAKVQEKEGPEPETEWTITDILEQAEEEQPDTVKTNNYMYWGLIGVLVCVLAFLLIALVVWFVLMRHNMPYMVLCNFGLRNT